MSQEAPEMIIRAMLPWFGGKRTLAPRIVQQLGQHTQYFEPFCGGLAVLFAKEPAQKETVNDLHGGATNLARVVQSYQVYALYERLQRVLVCEELLRDAGQYLEGTAEAERDPLEWAYWYFLASWMQRNGVAGTDRAGYQIAVRWTKNGGSPTVRFAHAVDSIPAWHLRLKNVVIMRRDAFGFLDRFEDCPETAIYADPPYMAGTTTGFENTAGEHSRYLHEFDHEDEEGEEGEQGIGAVGLFQPPGSQRKKSGHRRLAEILRGYKRARIVVSYYDCPEVRRLYPGWNVIDCAMNKRISGWQRRGVGAGAETAPEILLVNGPIYE